jgi:hypothetical protein
MIFRFLHVSCLASTLLIGSFGCGGGAETTVDPPAAKETAPAENAPPAPKEDAAEKAAPAEAASEEPGPITQVK